MLPDEVYKRRHFGTPQSFFLITVNYVVLILAVQVWANCTKIQSYFWITLGLLALYNVYSIRRNREDYDRMRYIAYAVSLVGLVIMFFAFRLKAQTC